MAFIKLAVLPVFLQLPLHCSPANLHSIQYLFGVKRAIYPPVDEGQDHLPGFAEKTAAQQIIIHSYYPFRVLYYPYWVTKSSIDSYHIR